MNLEAWLGCRRLERPPPPHSRDGAGQVRRNESRCPCLTPLALRPSHVAPAPPARRPTPLSPACLAAHDIATREAAGVLDRVLPVVQVAEGPLSDDPHAAPPRKVLSSARNLSIPWDPLLGPSCRAPETEISLVGSGYQWLPT